MSACYRSNHPDVVAVWQDSDRRYREVHELIRALTKKYDAQALVYQGSRYSLAALERSTAPDPGEPTWRYDRKAGGWVPRRSTKEGKAIGKEFDACQASGLGDVPGLPKYVPTPGEMFRMQGAAMFFDGEYVWAGWMAVDHEDVVKSGWGSFDEAMWELVKRSEFYAAQEAKDAEVAS